MSRISAIVAEIKSQNEPRIFGIPIVYILYIIMYIKALLRTLPWRKIKDKSIIFYG